MATQINININGFGTHLNGDRRVSGYSERVIDTEPATRWQDEFYTLKPGFSPVGYLHAERKLKKKKKKNCSNGQVCGFSCISKSKTCTANMTTAQFMEHNKAKRLAAAEKRKAAKAAKMAATNQDASTLAGVEGKIRYQRFESAALFDASGNQVFFKDGEKYEVSFNESEVAMMKDGVLTHNHPRGWEFPESDPRHIGNSFSDSDIFLASQGDLREIRAVSRAHLYQMKRPSDGWPDVDRIETVIYESESKVRADLTKKIKNGLISNEDAESMHFHQIMKRVASSINAEYTRTEL